MPLSNDSFYQSFRYNNYDFENLFKAYRSLGDEIIKNFRQTEKNLFIQDLGAYRIVPRQYLNIGGAQYNTNAISSNLSSVDSKRLQNRTHPYIPSIRKQKYYNTWDTIPSDVSMFEFVSNKDGTCYISKCNAGKELNIVIPYKDSDGNIVTGVSKAFYGNTIIKSVVIPSSVLWIDEESFKGCINLKSVSVSYGIQAIGKSAFEDCLSLVEIDFPSSILEIGDKAFKNCSSLVSISLSDSLAELGSEAFSGCINLKAALIPDTISVLNDYVFANCRNLESVNTPLVTSIIGSGAFKNCFKLKDIGLHENLSEIREEAFSGCVAIENIFIPKNVELISDSAFMDCKTLKDVTFEESSNILNIGDRVFAGCSFSAISLPDRIISMGDYVLYNNASLKFVRYPANSNINYVPTGTFLGCEKLTTIFLPKQVTKLNRLALSGCKELQTIFCDTISELVCFDNQECKNAAAYNLGIDIAQDITIIDKSLANSFGITENELDDVNTILSDIFNGSSTSSINFSKLSGYIKNEDNFIKNIALSILETINSYLPVDMDVFMSTSKLSGVYTHRQKSGIHDLLAYHTFIKGYNNEYAKEIDFIDSSTELFSEMWPTLKDSGEWGAISDGYARYCLRASQHNINADIDLGQCGDNVRLGVSDSTLVIDGAGDMWNKDTKDDYESILSNLFDIYENTLESVTFVFIKKGVTSICYGIFDYTAWNMKKIIIPKSITSIDDGAFEYTSYLTDIYYTGTQEEWNALLDNGVAKNNDYLFSATIHYNTIVDALGIYTAEFIDANILPEETTKLTYSEDNPGTLYIYKNSIADITYIEDSTQKKIYVSCVINETPSMEYKKPIIVSYEEAYPLSENAYDSSEIMSNNELCALLDASGYFIEFTASMNHEMINESAQIIGFELYDDRGRILIEGSDYAFLNNRLYLLGEYADALLHPADTMLELRNIAIDFETVKSKIGNNLDMQYTGELSKTEFCEHVKQYTLHALLGPKISALLSALSFNSEDNENIHLYDFVNATKEIREFMNSHNLTPYDFVISSSEGIDSRKLKPLFRYVDMVKPPETNYVFYCTGEYEEVYGEISDMLGGEYLDIYDEDYANQQITGEILNLNENLEVTNTLSYVTYHTQGSSRSETIQDELLPYQEMLNDILYVKQGDEWVEFSIVYNGKEEFLEITEGK